MKLDSFSDMKKLIDLCRKSGIDQISVDGVEIKFGLPVVKQSRNKKVTSYYTQPLIAEEDALTDEELLFYSSTGPSETTDQN